jgi:enoyl-CoA hydratase/carnithine racemase
LKPDSGVRLECDGPVATVTLCRPDVLNAQTPAMWTALRDIPQQLSGDIRVLLLQGAGRAFSAGIDLSVAKGSGEGSLAAMSQLSPQECADRIAVYQEAFTWLRRPNLVTVAAVRGYAIGAGFQLALACDLRVLASDAQFSMAEVTLGLVPDLGGTKRLVELVGYARAMELCLTGRRVGAAEAERMGLANLVVPPDELGSAARDLAAAVLAGDRTAIVEIKALLAEAGQRSYADQDRAEREAQTRRLRDLAGLGE